MKKFLVFLFVYATLNGVSQSCCSGGSGSPIAGGASQGVLQERQMELSLNYQYLGTDRFKAGDVDTARLFNYLYSHYFYGRVAYGLTKNLTLSLESGYFLTKTEIALHKKDTFSSKGVGDLIIFPRYNVYNRNTELTRTEITLGLGYKIPLGKYNDSNVVYQNPYTLKKYYATNPPTVQPTTGSQDFIFYGFIYRGWVETKFRVFANLLYIKKGWNPLGQKFGDFASVGLFAGKTIFKRIGVTLQVRAEWIDKMKYNHNIDMLALYGIDVNSTGSKKIFAVPQLSYSYKNFTVYGLGEIPIYQYVNRVQAVSYYNFIAGLTYRFYLKKSDDSGETGNSTQ
jgi:hypothetical protein